MQTLDARLTALEAREPLGPEPKAASAGLIKNVSDSVVVRLIRYQRITWVVIVMCPLSHNPVAHLNGTVWDGNAIED